MAEDTAPEAAGLAPLADLVLGRLEDCVDRVLRRLHEAELAPPGVGDQELRGDVREVLRLSLHLLRYERAAGSAELAASRSLGRRRARQGVDVGSVVRWLHVTELTLWELVTDLAKDAPGLCPTELLERAARFWSTFDELSSAATHGHHAAAQTLAVGVRRQALGLVAAIERCPESLPEAEELARCLGLDPHAPLVAAIHGGEHRHVAWPFPAVIADQGECTIVIAQPPADGADAERAVADALESQGLTPAGVGLQRRGVGGAQLSLRDAELAMAAAAVSGGVLRFRERWLEALAVTYRAEHEALVAPAVARIRSDPELRATLDAHVAHRGSLSGAGRVLGVHANTVAYRLRRFAEHTGVDPRTASGLALTQVALTLVPRTQHREAGAGARKTVLRAVEGGYDPRKAKMPPGWSAKPRAV